MEKLPVPLICLTIQHSLDDMDVMEYFLREFPTEAEKCIPIAFREVYVNPAKKFGVDTPLDAATLHNHLRVLWTLKPYHNDPVESAIRHYAYYLVPERIARGSTYTPEDLIDIAEDLIDIAVYHDVNGLILLLNMFPDADVNVDKLLRSATEAGSVDTVRWLVQPVSSGGMGANPNIPSLISGRTAVDIAIKKNRLDKLKILLDAGGKINKDNWWYITPSEEIQKYLQERQIYIYEFQSPL